MRVFGEYEARKPALQEPQKELFRVELIHLIDLYHPLVRMTGVVDWAKFEAAFEPLFDDQTGRPTIPTRLMVGLHYLKHLHGLSADELVEQWVENPYWQYLCGSKYFEHHLLIHPTSMTRWRKKIAAAGAEQLLQRLWPPACN